MHERTPKLERNWIKEDITVTEECSCGCGEERKMKLKVYADRMSQPSRAILIFCKSVFPLSFSSLFLISFYLFSNSIQFDRVNGIDFEEIHIELSKRQHLSPEFQGSNQFHMHVFLFSFNSIQFNHSIFISAINPFKKVPAIVDGRFKLFER